MLGASIEYYDIALYGYMAPVLAPIFFPFLDKTTSYFAYFLFEFIVAIFQFLGAKLFGSFGDKQGRKSAMFNSMLGISIATFTICLLPTYQQIGIISTVLFFILRILQRFFLGAEYNGGAIYCLEHENDTKQHGVVSSLYCAFTVLGIILASIIAFICNKMGSEYFRIAYGFSFLLTVLILVLRKTIAETPVYLNIRKNVQLTSDYKTQKPILKIIVASLFFGLIYGIPTKVFNVLLPISLDISSNAIMLLNTLTLFLYGSLLIFAGIVSKKYSPQKLMLTVTFIASILSYPLILILSTGSWYAIIFIKIIFTILAAFFIAPFHAWTQALFIPNIRYRTISISYTLGKCISTFVISFIFIAYEYFNEIEILGILLSLFSIITMRFIYEKYFDETTKALSCH